MIKAIVTRGICAGGPTKYVVTHGFSIGEEIIITARAIMTAMRGLWGSI